MCESCVSPILVLIVSMFYKRNEQVRLNILLHRRDAPTSIGEAHILVLLNGTYYLLLCDEQSQDMLNVLQTGLSRIFGGFLAYVRRLIYGGITEADISLM